jgi:hypothetical protein
MSEAAMWGWLRDHVFSGRDRDATRVENRVGIGTPDVNYCVKGRGEGWIELKYADAWPKGEDTVLQLEHYTPQQKVWGRRRRAAGGRCHLLLQVGTDWLLFDAKIAPHFVGKSPKKVLMEKAEAYWLGGLKPEELINELFYQAH